MEIKKKKSYIMVYCEDKVLLIKPTFLETWEFPGGTIEENENSKDTVLREFEEETNLSSQILQNVEQLFRRNIRYFAQDLGEWWDLDIVFFRAFLPFQEIHGRGREDEEISWHNKNILGSKEVSLFIIFFIPFGKNNSIIMDFNSLKKLEMELFALPKKIKLAKPYNFKTGTGSQKEGG